MLKFCANCCTMKYTLATSLDLENNLAWIFLYSILIKRSKVKEKERYTRLHFAYSTNKSSSRARVERERFVPSTKIWRGRTKRGFPRTWTGRDGNRASPRLAVESLTGEISTAISAIDIPRILRYPSCLSWRTANFQQEKEYLIS